MSSSRPSENLGLAARHRAATIMRPHLALLRTLPWMALALLVSSCDEGTASGACPRRGNGVWVYRLVETDPANPSAPAMLLETDPDALQLRAFARAQGISELYLSTSYDLLAHPNLPRFLAGLKRECLWVDAVVDWNYWDSLEPILDSIKDYDASRSDSRERFDGIHLDMEPWTGTGSDYGWVPSLLDSYQIARRSIAGTGLGLVADISPGKINSDDPRMVQDRQALLDTIDRVVFLAYEETQDAIQGEVDKFVSWAPAGTPFSVGTRIHEYGASNWVGGQCQNAACLEGIQARYRSNPGYHGWATFSFNAYFSVYSASFPDAQVRGSPICPTEACCRAVP